MYRMILYSEAIWLAFGEPPDFGVMKFAIASGASARLARAATAIARARTRSDGRRGPRRRGGAALTSGRKAAGILTRRRAFGARATRRPQRRQGASAHTRDSRPALLILAASCADRGPSES